MITEGRRTVKAGLRRPTAIAEEAAALYLTGVYLVTSEANCDE